MRFDDQTVRQIRHEYLPRSTMDMEALARKHGVQPVAQAPGVEIWLRRARDDSDYRRRCRAWPNNPTQSTWDNIPTAQIQYDADPFSSRA